MQGNTMSTATQALQTVATRVANSGDARLAQQFTQAIQSASSSSSFPGDQLNSMLLGAIAVLSSQPAFAQDCALLKNLVEQIRADRALSIAKIKNDRNW